ncbi:ATP-binding protein [Stenotrophomonas maltophilia]|uniref:hypothetical protein n=1 Tax=Stenotrophomonas maltophilia TaxID=40324 RepID=UPI001F2F3EB0|nr:hypothetical protein [Stenotrophomonas maltophilia]MCF3528041.1 ATP-binding protein [Stenotrophomonas maltophilia]MCF3531925.1 ATP-binding protein [Stenotrophomonas maltophilia]
MASDGTTAVQVASRFQRSVQLESDFAREDALDGYVLHGSGELALVTIARHVNGSQQRAFTWTGPYGGGKSTLALALAQLAGGTPSIRKKAKIALRLSPGDEVTRAFGGRKPWTAIPVVGRRQSLEAALIQSVDKYSPMRGTKRMRDGQRDVVAELVRRAEVPETGGVLVVLDEMGKLLEAASAAGEDIYLLQELAEAASRCAGNLVIVGVLHQAFEQYASRSHRGIQSEWAKIQGRFVDIPVVAGTDEVIDLIGGAIVSSAPHPKSIKVSRAIADQIRLRRPSTPSTLAASLDACWPLHPVTAALLGPCSRRRFGQNERSVFGFLSSSEPMGFQEYVHGNELRDGDYYAPARFWDYLRINFEPAILASADGHRWALASDAIERVEARFQEPHVSLIKAIALIDLFRNGSGVAATNDVLFQSVPGHTPKALSVALADLSLASVAVYRKHQSAWAVFAGSDFDVEAAVESAKEKRTASLDQQFKRLTALPALSARRHYFQTGTLRWFERVVCTPETAETLLKSEGKSNAGRFILLVPSEESSLPALEETVRHLCQVRINPLDAIGIPRVHLGISEQAMEVAALEHVASSSPQLAGDSVARREIAARLEHARLSLDADLRTAFATAAWHVGEGAARSSLEDGLAPIASTICDLTYTKAPLVFSELVNRDSLSSNAAKAQRLLMHRMLTHGDQEDLGFEGYPAEAGLYHTTLVPLQLHGPLGEGVGFRSLAWLEEKGDSSIIPLWQAWKTALMQASDATSLASLFEVAGSAPFGVRKGLLPIFALAFFLSHRSEIALYIDQVFTPELTEADADAWLQDPSRVSWKWQRLDEASRKMLRQLARRLEAVVNRPVQADPLDSARALVAWAFSLPTWTRKTAAVSEQARNVRSVLLRASDPLKTLFIDLPAALNQKPGKEVVDTIIEVVNELDQAYEQVLQRLGDQLLISLGHSGPVTKLRSRAKGLMGRTGDFRLDAFVSRLADYDGLPAKNESLASLATNRAGRDLNDQDMERASIQLADWAFQFRRIEMLASVQGRPLGRRAFAMAFGGERTVSTTIDVGDEDRDAIAQVREELLGAIRRKSVSKEVYLAALAEAGVAVLEDGLELEI